MLPIVLASGQLLTRDVTAAYNAIVGRMKSSSARNTARDRFEAAADELGDARDVTLTDTEGFAFQYDFETDKSGFKDRLEAMKSKLEKLRFKLERDFGKEFDLRFD